MKKTKIIAWMIVLIFCVQPISAMAQSGRLTGVQIDPKEQEEEEVVWQEDVDKKIDATIAILKIIQDEVKDMPVAAPAAVSAASAGAAVQPEEVDWSLKLKEAIKRISRVWRKLRKVEGVDEALPEAPDEWAKDMDEKLDKTMKAMQVMRDELQKIQEEDAEAKKK
ncbi:MAG: hypothetical protein P9L88_00010 [Candidatus Tantalella remota]|nr:hypothetical protein [Candidatus Tantalella remota]